MYEILAEKVKQCRLFAQTLHNSMGQELIEITNNGYWAEGESGKDKTFLVNCSCVLEMSCMNRKSCHHPDQGCKP